MSDRNPEYDLTAPHLPMNHPQNVERRLRDEIERLRAEVGEAIAERDRLFIRGREWAELSGRMERERDALRARIEGAAVAWAGVAQNGLWYAGQDWRDSAHVKLHLSGFGDAEDQKSIKACRVALVVVND